MTKKQPETIEECVALKEFTVLDCLQDKRQITDENAIEGTAVFKVKQRRRETLLCAKLFVDEDSKEEGEKEAKVHEKIGKHKNICNFEKSLIHSKHGDFYVMELLSTDLYGYIQNKMNNNEKISRKEVYTRMSEMVAGVEYMHSLHYAHLDIKLKNFGVDRQGVTKLIDFGFVEKFEDEIDNWCGTDPYMSPEMIELRIGQLGNNRVKERRILKQYFLDEDKEIGHAAVKLDVWALGIVLDMMLKDGKIESRYNWQVASAYEKGPYQDFLELKTEEDRRQFFRQRNPELQDEDITLLLNMLHFDPAERWDVFRIKQEVNRIVKNISLTSSSPQPTLIPPSRQKKSIRVALGDLRITNEKNSSNKNNKITNKDENENLEKHSLEKTISNGSNGTSLKKKYRLRRVTNNRYDNGKYKHNTPNGKNKENAASKIMPKTLAPSSTEFIRSPICQRKQPRRRCKRS